MTTRFRLTVTALLLPLVLASCAGAPGSADGSSPQGTPGVRSASGSFAGDVAPGKIRWGAAIQGNGNPARHESVAGVPLGVRRTYFGWDQRARSMVSTARADVAAGRLPWVSVKSPGWAVMASGALDGQIDEMLRALDAVGGPVWLTVHHEPEGGNGTAFPDEGAGSEPNWRAMQRRVRFRMDAVGTRNIAFAPILMAWTFDPASRRSVANWWVDGIWDFIGIDYYVNNEAVASMDTASWRRVRAAVGAKGLKVAVGEWGNRGVDARAAQEMRDLYRLSVAPPAPGLAQVIALSYFDSNLNSPMGGWQLSGEPLAAFRQLMTAPTSLRSNQS